MKRKALIIRYGAYGDSLIITPFLRELKRRGYHVIVETSERGVEVLQNNPNVDTVLYYKTDSVPIEKLQDYFDKTKERIAPEKYVNFTQSIEVAIALHPDKDDYYMTKEQRFMCCNKNYYEFTFRWAKMQGVDLGEPTSWLPELFFTKKEIKQAKKHVLRDKFNVLVGLIGSGHSKLYPWFNDVIHETYKLIPDVNFITVGDRNAAEVETSLYVPVTKLSGLIPMRQSMALTGLVDLVISPDTGLLHAAGCYNTPKIGLLGHTNIENITKHFKNDYSIEAECECAPCFRIIYNLDQCPTDKLTKSAWCMGYGIHKSKVIDKILEVYHKKKENN